MANFTFKTTIRNAEVLIDFEYSPEEEMVRYYPDGSGYPGCPASIDNYAVYWERKKFNNLKMEWEDVQIEVTGLMDELEFDIEELCFEHVSNQYEY